MDIRNSNLPEYLKQIYFINEKVLKQTEEVIKIIKEKKDA